MNEELKLSALSSGNPEQDDRASYGNTAELSDFLLRRQLLTMETKRIRSVLVEVEDEIKGRQSQLGDFRDRVLASLREHRALRHQALREERALRESLEKRQTLRELPKTAERYVRRRAKQLFAYQKPGNCSPGIR